MILVGAWVEIWLQEGGGAGSYGEEKWKHKTTEVVDPYIYFYLFAAQLVVTIFIDFFENICGRMWVADVQQFNFENQGGTARNHVASSTITVTQRRWNGQFSLLAYKKKTNEIQS